MYRIPPPPPGKQRRPPPQTINRFNASKNMKKLMSNWNTTIERFGSREDFDAFLAALSGGFLNRRTQPIHILVQKKGKLNGTVTIPSIVKLQGVRKEIRDAARGRPVPSYVNATGLVVLKPMIYARFPYEKAPALKANLTQKNKTSSSSFLI